MNTLKAMISRTDLTYPEILIVIEELTAMPNPACQTAAILLKDSISSNRPVIPRNEVRAHHKAERDRFLRIAARHAPGATTEERLRALRREIRRMTPGGDLAAVGDETPAQSAMRRAIVRARENGPIRMGPRNLRLIVGRVEIEASKDFHDGGHDAGYGCDDGPQNAKPGATDETRRPLTRCP